MELKKIRTMLKEEGLIFCISRAMNRISVNLLKFIYKNKQLLDIIIIESHNDFDCNGGAFYDYLINLGLNKKYKIVWWTKNGKYNDLPKNVFTFEFFGFSLRKAYYLTRAKYILCEDFIINKIRSDQISVYCTHGGCTFKNVKGLIVVPDGIDYILSSSKEYDPYMCENYSIPYPNNRMLHIGFPSHDILFSKNKDEVLKITKTKFKKMILWLPTFRLSKSGRTDSEVEQPFGIPLIDEEKQLIDLNERLKSENCLLVIKLHPRQELSVIRNIPELSNICLLDGMKTKKMCVDVYRLMTAADALISDYSSVAYSYILLDRPIGFVLSDLESYKLGFVVDDMSDFLPGEKIYSFEDFSNFINDVILQRDNFKNQRNKLCEWLYEYRDGNACERLSQFLKIEGE